MHEVDYVGCDGDTSLTWTSVSVRFRFEVKSAPPMYAKEFKAFLFDHPEQIKKMDEGPPWPWAVKSFMHRPVYFLSDFLWKICRGV
jgi:hypothetical protein